MKSKEELNALKEEVEQLSKKLSELSDEELRQVAGGAASPGLVSPLIDAVATDTDAFRKFASK